MPCGLRSRSRRDHRNDLLLRLLLLRVSSRSRRRHLLRRRRRSDLLRDRCCILRRDRRLLDRYILLLRRDLHILLLRRGRRTLLLLLHRRADLPSSTPNLPRNATPPYHLHRRRDRPSTPPDCDGTLRCRRRRAVWDRSAGTCPGRERRRGIRSWTFFVPSFRPSLLWFGILKDESFSCKSLYLFAPASLSRLV